MLQIQKVSKKYTTGDLVQTALDGVSLNLRDNEFVAILGPSGSGKTTLLNIIGGLDRYDSGDLIINGVSTKKYKDRDWDSYRNHTIGFVFQSYNLIPHQSILSNVELALTISGISRGERRNRARKALDEVGLEGQYHKRPNQLSGGQMQRVAIARALVNNPDILLADEPTGALDSDTSIQVMELLKEVAKDRLVVMVTHNPELAEEYATRIVRLKDGAIINDSDPYEVDTTKISEPKHKNLGKSSMSRLTSLSLSFNNLRTKKGRTILTSFAGSIGIIGIALILALSTGVNTYIDNIQRDTMSSYPITIDAQTMDISALMEIIGPNDDKEITHDLDGVYANNTTLETMSSVTSSITENNLTAFKKYLDDPDSEINKYIGENGIVYSYNTKYSLFTHDSDGVLINTDGSTITDMTSAVNPMAGMNSMMSGSSTNMEELIPGSGDNLISNAIKESYDVVYGQWPAAYDEVTLVLDANNEIDAQTLYEIGILPSAQYKELATKVAAGEEITLDAQKWSYEDICKQSFYLIPQCDMYVKSSNGTFASIADDTAAVEQALKNAIPLKITAVIKPNGESDSLTISKPFAYTQALTNYLIDYTNKSEVVKAQIASPDINVTNGLQFAPADDAAKIADAKTYLTNLGVSDKAQFCKQMMQSAYTEEQMQQTSNMSEAQWAAMLDEYLVNPDNSSLLTIYNTYISTGTYDENMTNFGVVSLDAPSSINIYADTFEDKDSISDCIDDYNKDVAEEDQITYTDYVALLMSSVTTIINVISYVLIAFVAVSLIVSSIMIGIITYISVLERTKEIGILRAIGASKRNISQVFNSETLIIGFLSGLIGIGITLLLTIPINAVIHSVAGSTDVNAILPVSSAVVLIILSTILTLIGGLIPAKKASKKDPVTALRTE